MHIDYHVQVLGHYYSAPYQLVKPELEVRITANTVELMQRNHRVPVILARPSKEDLPP